MGFALHLEEMLDRRHEELQAEFAAGMDLSAILTGHLLAVEGAAETDLRTSILLLDDSGRHLRHCAAPNLPQAYCDAIDGGEIGPSAGSCGTAAFLAKPIYVTDIETDPLWDDYRDVALLHGLRASWSTPIFDGDRVLGTFAVYHMTPRGPTAGEVQSIALIADRVASAILFDQARRQDSERSKPVTIVLAEPANDDQAADFSRLGDRLGDCAASLRSLAGSLDSDELAERVQSVALDCEALVAFVQARGKLLR